jgi:hypothetical protein
VQKDKKERSATMSGIAQQSTIRKCRKRRRSDQQQIVESLNSRQSESAERDEGAALFALAIALPAHGSMAALALAVLAWEPVVTAPVLERALEYELVHDDSNRFCTSFFDRDDHE